MGNVRMRRLLLFILVWATIAGCETVVPPEMPIHARTFIGVISIVTGTNVFLNASPVGSGTSVFDGDRVSTGPGSSALIELPNRGVVQLDENTDPILEFVREGACVLVHAFKIGQLFAQGREICVRDAWGMEAAARSSIIEP